MTIRSTAGLPRAARRRSRLAARARFDAAACVAALVLAGPSALGAAGPAPSVAAAPASPGAAARTAMQSPADVTAGEAAQPPAPGRQQQLLRIVRQDCGSCHGMRLTGGLGPAITAQAVAGIPADSLAATIYHGRPGTPMPGWKTMISAAEAEWIAARLQQGLAPEEGMSR